MTNLSNTVYIQSLANAMKSVNMQLNVLNLPFCKIDGSNLQGSFRYLTGRGMLVEFQQVHIKL